MDEKEFDEEQDRIDRGMIEAQVKEQMAEEVNSKIADMIHGGVGRQVIDSKDALDYLVRVVGKELTTILCSITNSDLIAFRKSKTTKRVPRTPTPLQIRNVSAAYM